MQRFVASLCDVLVKNKDRIVTVGKTLSVSLLNQVVSSGTNFLFSIYLVRVLTGEDFGIYGIGFAITLLYAGVGDAIFLTQMVVHVPDKLPNDKLPYAGRMLVSLLAFCLITILLVAAALALLKLFSLNIIHYFNLSLAIAAASISYLIKDFFIRHAYTIRRENNALLVNISIATSMILLLLFLNKESITLNSEVALLIYALSNFFGGLVGFYFANLPILTANFREIRGDLREAWVGGKWALGGVGLTWSQTQAYMYVTAIFIGPAGVGLINAAKIMITPALFLMPAITQLAVPRLAALRNTDQLRMIKISLLFSIGLVCFATIYSLILVVFGEDFGYLLIGKYKYDVIFPVMMAWCTLLVLQFSRFGTAIFLQVTKEFKALTLLSGVSLLAAVAAAVILMSLIGVAGAVLGSAIGELVLSILLLIKVKTKFTSLRIKDCK